MNAASVRVRIYDEGKCINEHETCRSDGNDLKTLIEDLRNTQSVVNDLLTALVQQRDVSGGAREMKDQSASSDIESDSAEEEQEEEEGTERETNPKKCKLST